MLIVQRCVVEDVFDRVVKEGLLWVSYFRKLDDNSEILFFFFIIFMRCEVSYTFSAVEVLLLESQWFLDDTIHWRGARRN